MLSAKADDIPTLRVEETCRGIVRQSTDPLAGGQPTVTFEQCMQAERLDKERLSKGWSTFSVEEKRHCVAEARMGGESSYTDFITCLEMARDVKKLRPPR